MNSVLRCGDRQLAIGTRTFVMGIVNVTPDSFSDGGAFLDPARAIDQGMRLLDDGADLLDIGGESTRPGAAGVDVDVEIGRVLPVIEGLVARGVTCLSIDTRHTRVAAAALAAGASWVNDVSALLDEGMVTVAARAQAVVLMHARAAPWDRRQDYVAYDDVVADVLAFLRERVAVAVAGGVDAARIVVDPGLGFGKSVEDNVRLLANAEAFGVLGPVLIGASRKRFLGVLAGRGDVVDRDPASVGAACAAAIAGAHLVRVHAVRQTVDALRVVDAVVHGALRAAPP
ncbi:MAG: dihydropteroate synthase [Deltaproteobacteria bacterium]|nr:dihydropteroate synthase [Deltaproteobacteria bacterium]